MKPVRLSHHCQVELLIRWITKEQIEETIRNPDKTSKGKLNRLIAWKYFKEQDTGVKVVYVEGEKEFVVMTAYPKKSI